MPCKRSTARSAAKAGAVSATVVATAVARGAGYTKAFNPSAAVGPVVLGEVALTRPFRALALLRDFVPVGAAAARRVTFAGAATRRRLRSGCPVRSPAWSA